VRELQVGENLRAPKYSPARSPTLSPTTTRREVDVRLPVLVDDSVPFQATSMLCTFANLATNSLNRVCSGDEPKETISFTSPNAQPKSVESSGSSRGHRT